jgi:hypothetical protein
MGNDKLIKIMSELNCEMHFDIVIRTRKRETRTSSKKQFKLAGFDSNKPTRNKRRRSFAVVESLLITGVTPALLTSRLFVAISKPEISRPPNFTILLIFKFFKVREENDMATTG